MDRDRIRGQEHIRHRERRPGRAAPVLQLDGKALVVVDAQDADFAVAAAAAVVIGGQNDTITVPEDKLFCCYGALGGGQRVNRLLYAAVQLQRVFPAKRQNLYVIAAQIPGGGLLCEGVHQCVLVFVIDAAKAAVRRKTGVKVDVVEGSDVASERVCARILSMVLRQGHTGKSQLEQIVDDIPGADGGKLVPVADDDDAAVLRRGAQKAGQHVNGEHRSLVHDDKLDVVHRLDVEKIGQIVGVQEAVDGRGGIAGMTGEIPGRLAGGRTLYEVLRSRMLDDGAGDRRFAAPGPGEQEGQPVAQAHGDRMALLVREGDAADAERIGENGLGKRRCAQQSVQVLCRGLLLQPYALEIDAAAVETYRASLYRGPELLRERRARQVTVPLPELRKLAGRHIRAVVLAVIFDDGCEILFHDRYLLRLPCQAGR